MSIHKRFFVYLVSHQQRTCRPAIYLSHVATPDLFFAAQSSQTSRTQWNRAYGEVRSSHPTCRATCCMTTTKTLDCRDKVRLLLQDSARDTVLRRPGSVPGSLQLACSVPSSSAGHFHVLLLQVCCLVQLLHPFRKIKLNQAVEKLCKPQERGQLHSFRRPQLPEPSIAV